MTTLSLYYANLFNPVADPRASGPCRRLAGLTCDTGFVGDARTTTIARPRGRRASDAGRSRIADMTRPLARAQRIAPDRRHVLLFGMAALVIAAAIAGALFLLPVRTWFEQDDQLAERRVQLEQLQQVNSDLLDEVTRLQTPEGIREAAREELGLIDQNEDRLSLRGTAALPSKLPRGWPYTPVTRIIKLRSAP